MAEEAPTTARLEAFSDGVIAVIITVMVLELKVPHADGLAALRELAPGLAIYLLSFAFCGVYWLNHQHLVRRAERAGHTMQYANLGFLFCLSLLPFSTAYVVDKKMSGSAVSFYAFTLFIVAVAFMLLRLTIHRHLRHRNAFSTADQEGFRNHMASIVLYAAGVVAGLFFPRSVLWSIAILTFIWAIPNLSLRTAKEQWI
ncbi:MAG TPA: TMEM175 family protein [Acidobacteriaceae bacterium]